MAKKSFWQRSEDYAKKVSSELIEQIKRRCRAVAEAVEAGRANQRRKLLDRQAVYRGQQPLPDEPRHPGRTGRQPLGNLQPDPGSGRAGP